jgi:tripartite-type tricarboxylate transporter receptor subunit TctC
MRIVVPFAPGGASDILARLIAKELTERLKQPVIVENKPGAGGTIGADFVAKSPPDGYTLLLADSSVLMTFPSLYPNLPYKATDLIPVANVATFGLILIAPASSRFASFTEVIAYDKAQPGKLNMASPGTGSSNHLTLERINAAAGTKIVHIPYKGAGPAINDVIGGQVDMTLASGAASKPLLDGGKVKALAVTSAKRNPLLPQVPTMAESGLVGFESIAGQGLFVRRHAARDRHAAQHRGERDHQVAGAAGALDADGHRPRRAIARAVRRVARARVRPVDGADPRGGHQGGMMRPRRGK